jgi:hypothetical protein
MFTAIGIASGIVTAIMLLVSLKALFVKHPSPGVVEERLDTALEVELMAEEIERIANEE